MKIHCIRHEPFEGLACIENWIFLNKHKLSYTYTFLNQSFPDDYSFDLIIIMGGTATLYNSLNEPWFLEETEFLENCIKNKKKVLGICLGSQILATILGSKVYQGKAKEIGWFPVKFNLSDNLNLPFLPEGIETFHWHGDTFDIPDGAIKLASSKITPNQGFIFDDRVFALQFHPEMTNSSLKKIIKAAGKELEQKGDFIHSAEQILSRMDLVEVNNSLMFKILDYLEELK
jgi:GMP synthase (glutamine-hydrolysing)